MTKLMQGKVVSMKMDKTAIVAVERRVRHPVYTKIIQSTKRYKTHLDKIINVKEGDTVVIEETRPMSRDKRHRIREVIAK